MPVAPAKPEISYDLTLMNGVAGLRLVSNVLELLDAGGMPRLRVRPPRIQNGDCSVVDARLEVTGCANGHQPARSVGPAGYGARSGVVPGFVTWDPAAVTYPALVDPGWITLRDP